MGTPAAAIGDPADLLHVQVHHVTGPVCIDLPGLAVALSAWVDEPPSAETELGQVAGDGAAVDRESELDEFEVIRLADHLCSRRQVSMRSRTQAGVARGLRCGVDERS